MSHDKPRFCQKNTFFQRGLQIEELTVYYEGKRNLCFERKSREGETEMNKTLAIVAAIVLANLLISCTKTDSNPVSLILTDTTFSIGSTSIFRQECILNQCGRLFAEHIL
jgi:hypothetical protein